MFQLLITWKLLYEIDKNATRVLLVCNAVVISHRCAFVSSKSAICRSIS